jgi:hypothetical protein
LASLTDSEKAQVLDALIARNATLVARADREGRRLLARVDVGDVAAAVADALLGLQVMATATTSGCSRGHQSSRTRLASQFGSSSPRSASS